MSDYPEHDKMSAIQDKSQAIGEFLDYSGYVLCEYVTYDELDEEPERLAPVGRPIQNILAEYFEIDLNKIEEEKRQMLAGIAGGR